MEMMILAVATEQRFDRREGNLSCGKVRFSSVYSPINRPADKPEAVGRVLKMSEEIAIEGGEDVGPWPDALRKCDTGKIHEEKRVNTFGLPRPQSSRTSTGAHILNVRQRTEHSAFNCIIFVGQPFKG
jgi:hypothetical protein